MGREVSFQKNERVEVISSSTMFGRRGRVVDTYSNILVAGSTLTEVAVVLDDDPADLPYRPEDLTGYYYFQAKELRKLSLLELIAEAAQ